MLDDVHTAVWVLADGSGQAGQFGLVWPTAVPLELWGRGYCRHFGRRHLLVLASLVKAGAAAR